MKMIYAKSNEERLEIAKGSEILMDLAQVMKKFVNDETILEYKSLTKKVENIARKNGLQEGKREGKKEGIQVGRASGLRDRSIEIAKNLLNDHMNIEKIMQYTGLSKQEILKLQEN